MKHEEARAAAAMISACQDALDYDHTHHCRVCGKPVRIRVRNPLSAVLVLGHWNEKMGGKCKACLEIGG